jgi:hypothetical protein
MPPQCEVSEGFFEGDVVGVVKLAEGGDFCGTESGSTRGAGGQFPESRVRPAGVAAYAGPDKKACFVRCL